MSEQKLTGAQAQDCATQLVAWLNDFGKTLPKSVYDGFVRDSNAVNQVVQQALITAVEASDHQEAIDALEFKLKVARLAVKKRITLVQARKQLKK